jgi:hypothetical protein
MNGLRIMERRPRLQASSARRFSMKEAYAEFADEFTAESFAIHKASPLLDFTSP